MITDHVHENKLFCFAYSGATQVCTGDQNRKVSKLDMLPYGIKINNYSAGSIEEVTLGVREYYDTTPAMLTNSLLLDFLMDNKLKVSANGFTRDVICIDFNYGSASHKTALAKFKKQVSSNRIERKCARNLHDPARTEKAERAKTRLQDRYRRLKDQPKDYTGRTREQLRTQFYTNGVDIRYPRFNRSHEITGYDTIHYKMLYRSTGKAKTGKCMFIRKSLYSRAHDFLWMGIKLSEKNAPIVEIGAYSSLVASTIEDRLKLEPENILILRDIDSYFITDVLSVETDEDKHCFVKKLSDYRVKNTVFDGQGLIDSSIFPARADGYILLRQHFCKMAAFKTHIQKYFRDYFGDDYETATVTDMFGIKHLAKDIKAITTENSMKWIKFSISYDTWCNKVWENGALFGVVKTAHASKFGDMQRMSYQMVNALNPDTMDEVLAPMHDYIYKLKTDDEAYQAFLKRTAGFCNDNEVLLALAHQNPEFIKCDYFIERRVRNISAYMADVRSGHILQSGDNLVVVGNPYGMLLHAVGEDASHDPTLVHEDGCIRCWTNRFDAGAYLAEFRSPFNSRNSLGYLHNVHHDYLTEYFDLGRQIIAVNLIGTDFQSLNNGSDQDSDSIYVTDDPYIVEHAKYCYSNYCTIDNNIPKEQNIYDNTPENFALIDNKLAAARVDIGEASNVAQLGLSYTYNDFGKDFEDFVAILAVGAQVCIDSAKRAFDVDMHSEIQRIKKAMDIQVHGYPAFFAAISPEKAGRINPEIACPMNTVYSMKIKPMPSQDVRPIGDFFIKQANTETKHISKKVEHLIEKYISEYTAYGMKRDHDSDEYLLLRSDYEDLIRELRRITLPDKYRGLMSWLIDRAFAITPDVKRNRKLTTRLNRNRSLLLKTLYDLNPSCFLKCFT